MLEAGEHLKPENFRIVNPNLNYSVDAEFLSRELKKAQEAGEESLRGFLAKHLNVEIGLALKTNSWAGAEFWERSVEKGLTLDEILKRSDVITVGADGGGLDDLFGLSVIGRDATNGKWLHWARPETLATKLAPLEDLVHILSPFDPIVIQRRRLQRFFGYQHRFEAYVPKDRRIHGYFVMPLLVDDSDPLGTEDFATQNSLTTLSDLGALGQPVVLASAVEGEHGALDPADRRVGPLRPSLASTPLMVKKRGRWLVVLFLVADGVGYVRIRVFGPQTMPQLGRALRDLRSRRVRGPASCCCGRSAPAPAAPHHADRTAADQANFPCPNRCPSPIRPRTACPRRSTARSGSSSAPVTTSRGAPSSTRSSTTARGCSATR